jgi:phosphatidylglycerophosphatase A
MSPDPADRPSTALDDSAQRDAPGAAVPAPRSPSLRFAWSHPWHFIALGAGSGALRPAPGTWGTLFAWGTFVLGSRWWGDPVWVALILLGLYFGAWAAQRTGTALGRADHGAIVIDEVVAFWIVLLLLPKTLAWQAAGFVIFRAFDILKPPPIRQADRRFKNGVGVMLDDLIAALYTLLTCALILRLTR